MAELGDAARAIDAHLEPHAERRFVAVGPELVLLAALVWLDPTVQSWLEAKGVPQPAIARQLQNLEESLPKVLIR